MIKKILSVIPYFYFLFLPFIFYPDLANPYELPKVIFFISFTNIFIGLYCWRILSRQEPKVKLGKITKLLIILTILLIISSLINGFTYQSVLGQIYRNQGIATLITYFLFFILLIKVSSSPQITKAVVIGGLVNALLIIIQGAILKIFHFPVYNYNGRITGLFGNPNFAGGFLALCLPFTLFYPFLPLVFTWPVFLTAVILTGSRGALITFFILSSAFAFGKIKEKEQRIKFILAVVILFAVIVPHRQLSKIEDRSLIWHKGVKAFMEKPIFGWGIENFATAFQSNLDKNDFDLYNIRVDKAHNEILEIAVAGGIPALIVYLLLLKEAFSILWKNRKDKWAETNLYVLTGFFILFQFNVLNLNEYLFFYLALAGAERIDHRNPFLKQPH